MKNSVLLIDDSVTIHRVVDLSVDTDRFDMVKAFSSDEAEARLSEHDFDLILLDNKLDGIVLSDYVADLKTQNAATGVVLLVGAFDRFTDEDLTRTGADAWLTKPFDSQTLNDTLARMCGMEIASAAMQQEEPAPKERHRFDESTILSEPDADAEFIALDDEATGELQDDLSDLDLAAEVAEELDSDLDVDVDVDALLDGLEIRLAGEKPGDAEQIESLIDMEASIDPEVNIEENDAILATLRLDDEPELEAPAIPAPPAERVYQHDDEPLFDAGSEEAAYEGIALSTEDEAMLADFATDEELLLPPDAGTADEIAELQAELNEAELLIDDLSQALPVADEADMQDDLFVATAQEATPDEDDLLGDLSLGDAELDMDLSLDSLEPISEDDAMTGTFDEDAPAAQDELEDTLEAVMQGVDAANAYADKNDRTIQKVQEELDAAAIAMAEFTAKRDAEIASLSEEPAAGDDLNTLLQMEIDNDASIMTGASSIDDALSMENIDLSGAEPADVEDELADVSFDAGIETPELIADEATATLPETEEVLTDEDLQRMIQNPGESFTSLAGAHCEECETDGIPAAPVYTGNEDDLSELLSASTGMIADETDETIAEDFPKATLIDETPAAPAAPFATGTQGETFSATVPVQDAGPSITISLSKNDIMNMLGASIDRKFLQQAVYDVLSKSLEEVVREVVPAIAEKLIRQEIEKLKQGE